MTSFIYPTDLQFGLQARYPGSDVGTPARRRSALRINLDVRRARRADAQGR